MKPFLNSFNTRLWFGTLLSSLLPWLLLSPFMHMKVSSYGVSILLVTLAHYINAKTLYAITDYPGKKTALSVIPNTVLWFFLAWVTGKFLSLPYSLKYLALGGALSFLFSYSGFIFRVRRTPVFGFVPLSQAIQANQLPGVEWIRMDDPKLPERPVDGIVADLHDPKLDAKWQRFLANQTLQSMPVYHVRKIQEELTGRVKITHMYENDLGSLLPPKSYLAIKRWLDTILVLLSFPLTLPIMLITAIAIKLESPGPVLFIQNRVGQKGKEFRIYKFRSMCRNSEEGGVQMASVDDMRVTRIGRFIRKVRIDELPQFFNILKGEMSLIGPRPEQKIFADEFETEIPFYNYRHIVKPGISGWAQVTHGYAANIEETRIKLEYDLFYIKNFSFALDVVIFIKTIKTMLTGFGAR